MATFGDLKTEGGLRALNEFLASRSYIDGYIPSQADVSVFTSVGSAPSGHRVNEFVHVARWYRHINSYSADEQNSFPGVAEPAQAKKAEDDDDFDLFGDGDDEEEEEETEEEKQKKEELLAAYHAKKATKVVIIAKSSLLIDVKPWEDTTDMVKLEECVRTVQCDGLVWGQSKLIPLAYGVKKLQISAVIEDDKVSTDYLDEEITKFSRYVQSMDIAAFNKI